MSGGYNAPHIPPPFPRYEPRRPGIPGPFDRPPPPVAPPPPNPPRPYDRYIPQPVAGYRDEYPGAYRPAPYAQEYPPPNLYSRSPSPDRYAAAAGTEHWGDARQNYWAAVVPPSSAPPYATAANPNTNMGLHNNGNNGHGVSSNVNMNARGLGMGWPDRTKAVGVPQSPAAMMIRGRDVATLATPMFEPSENWKQKQGPHRPPPQAPTHEAYRPYHPEPHPYRRDLFPAVGGSRHYDPARPPAGPAPLSSRSRSPERRLNAPSPMRPKQQQGLSRKSSRSSIASSHAPASAQHSRHPSDSVPRPGSSASVSGVGAASGSGVGAGAGAGNVNLLGRHRSPSSGIPGLSASLPVKPEAGSPRIPPAEVVTNGKASVRVELEKPPPPPSPPTREEKMDVDVPVAVKEEVVRLPTPPKSEKRAPSPIRTDQIVDVEMSPASPEATRAPPPPPPPSPPTVDAAPALAKAPTPAPDPMRPETPVVPEVPEPPPKSPTPPPPWEDTSTVWLDLKPLSSLDAPSAKMPHLLNALRSVVQLRSEEDHQTRDEIVDGPLRANQVVAARNVPFRPAAAEAIASSKAKATPSSLIEEVLGGQRHQSRVERFEAVRPSLVDHFEERQAKVTSKVERLSKEYLALHEKWRAHCAALSEHQKSKVHTTEHEASLYVAGRTTRHRGALADAARSDLEMEQIIASLESNDAMDPNYLSMKNAATIPDMISVTNGQVDLLFDDTNHLVEYPDEYYAVRTGIDDWTDEEKRIFIDKFAQYPKQFGMIAQFIPDKTASQCVDYYYLHKKRQIDFRKIVSQLGPKKKRRGGGRKKKGNALLTDIAQHDAEVGKLPTGFVVPTRVAKSRKGIGGRPKGTQAGAGNSATATPQPEPRSARLQAQAAAHAQAQLAAEAAAATTPSTPEPESTRRGRRAKQPASTASAAATAAPSASFSVSAPVSVSASISASSAPVSTSGPGPSPLASVSTSMAPTPAFGVIAASGYQAFPSPAPTPSLSVISIPPAPLMPPQIEQVASSQSGSSSLTKMEDDDTPDLERPTKKVKRVRKQVKSVAIIHDEPPSPPPESELHTPDGERVHEPASVLSKTTKILSDLQAKRSVSASGTSTGDEKGKAKSRGRRAKDKAKGKAEVGDTKAATNNTLDLSEPEKNLFIDLLVRHGLDFQRIAMAMPGKAPHDLEWWYFTKESSLKLNEAWQERLVATKAVLAGATVLPSPPPMGSLTPQHMAIYPTHFTAYPACASQPPPRPDYPMAIPFKPQSMQAAPSAAGTSVEPGQAPPIPAYHSPYSHSMLGPPAFGYPYASPMHYGAMYPQYPPSAMSSLPVSQPGTPNAIQQAGSTTPSVHESSGLPLGENQQPYYPPPGMFY